VVEAWLKLAAYGLELAKVLENSLALDSCLVEAAQSMHDALLALAECGPSLIWKVSRLSVAGMLALFGNTGKIINSLNSEISLKIDQFFSLLYSPRPPSYHYRCTLIDSSRHSIPFLSLLPCACMEPISAELA